MSYQETHIHDGAERFIVPQDQLDWLTRKCNDLEGKVKQRDAEHEKLSIENRKLNHEVSTLRDRSATATTSLLRAQLEAKDAKIADMVDTFSQHNDPTKAFVAKQKARMEGFEDLMKGFMQRQSDSFFDFESDQRERLAEITHSVRSSFTEEPAIQPAASQPIRAQTTTQDRSTNGLSQANVLSYSLASSESGFGRKLEDAKATQGRRSSAHNDDVEEWLATTSHTAPAAAVESSKTPGSGESSHAESLSDHDSTSIISDRQVAARLDKLINPIKDDRTLREQHYYAAVQSPRLSQPPLAADAQALFGVGPHEYCMTHLASPKPAPVQEDDDVSMAGTGPEPKISPENWLKRKRDW